MDVHSNMRQHFLNETLIFQPINRASENRYRLLHRLPCIICLYTNFYTKT